MRPERNLTIRFAIVAAAIVLLTLWLGNWLSRGGMARAKAGPGQIVFISDRTDTPDIWLMDEDGSGAHRLAALAGQERETAFAPEGELIYYTAEFGGEELQIGRVRPSGRSAGRLLSTSGAQGSISVASKAKLIGYVSNSKVWVAGLDGTRPEQALPSHGDQAMDLGELAGQQDSPPERRYSFAWLSPGGWVAAISQGYDDQRAYVLTDHDRKTETLTDPEGTALVAEEISLAWSPDGSRLAVSALGQPTGGLLAIYAPVDEEQSPGIPGEAPERVLLVDAGGGSFGIRRPAWAPDGKMIAFERLRYFENGAREEDGLWMIPAEGGAPQRIVEGDASHPAFSPDGRYLLYQSGPDLMRYDVESKETHNLTSGKGLNRYATWSPVLDSK